MLPSASSPIIRDAIEADLVAIAEMGERFHAEAGWGDICAYDRRDCEATLAHLVESPDGILLVAEAGGALVGMAGGLAHPLYFNRAHKTGQELFWWVAPGLRDGTGRALLDRLEDAARSIGCISWAMMCLARVKPALMGRLYERRGYRASELTYIKRL